MNRWYRLVYLRKEADGTKYIYRMYMDSPCAVLAPLHSPECKGVFKASQAEKEAYNREYADKWTFECYRGQRLVKIDGTYHRLYNRHNRRRGYKSEI